MNSKPTYEALERRVATLEKQLLESRQIQKRLLAEAKADLTTYKSFLELAPHAISITRLEDGHYLQVNPAFCRITGYSKEEALGRSTLDLGLYTRPESRERLIAAIKKHKRIDGLEAQWKSKDGTIGYNLMSMRLVRYKGKACVLTMATNITSLKHSQLALQKSEEQYRLLVENANEGILIAQDARIRFANAKTQSIIGYSQKELKSRPFVDFIHSDDRQMVLERHQNRLAGKTIVENYRFRLLTRAGDSPWVEIRTVTIEWEGQPAILIMLADITPHIEALEALRQSEENHRKILATCPDAIVITRRSDGHFVQANEAFCNNTGYSMEEVLSQSAIELGLYEDPAQRQALTDAIARQGYVDGFEITFRARDGNLLHDLISARPIRYEGHDCILIVAKNINTLKQAQKALTDSEARYRNILQSMQEGYYETDLAGNFVFFNQALSKIFGHAPQELLGMNYRQYTPAESAGLLFESFNRVFKTRKANKIIGYEAIHKDGSRIMVETSANLLHDPDGQPMGFYGVSRDRTEQKLAEEALRQSEENYRMILALAPDSITITRLEDGKYLQVNKAFCELTGYREEDVIGRTVLELELYADPEDRQRMIETLQQEGQIQATETHFRSRSGELIIGLLSARPVRFNNEACLLIVVTDITSLSKAQHALARSEAKYRNILENMAEGYYEVDTAGTILFFNGAFSHMLGYAPQTLLGMNYREYAASEEMADKVFETYSEIYRNDIPNQIIEFEAVRQNGQHIQVEISASLLRDGEGQKIGFCGVCRDRTQQIEAEKALRASEERYRSILEHMKEGYYEIDLQGSFTFFNEATRKLHGYETKELMGMNSRQYLSPETAKTFHDIFTDIYRTAQPASIFEYEVIQKNGNIRLCEMSVSLLRDANDEPVGFRGITRDRTEQIMAERALKKSEESLRITLNSIGDAVIATDTEGRIVRMNPVAQKLTGWQIAAANGQPLAKVFQIINEATGAAVESPVQKVLKEGRIIGLGNQTLLIARDGKKRPISDSAAPMMDGDGRITGAVMVFRDVTQRRKAEKALRESEEKYRLLVENANEGIYINQDGVMKFANPKLKTLTGYDDIQLESMALGDLVMSEDKKLYAQYLQKSDPRKPSELYAFRLQNQNGETYWVDLNAIPITWEGRNASLNFIRDVSLQKKIEAQLLQAQKMKAVGTLAGGIAHDFNNLLMGIQGNSSLMMLDLAEGDPKLDKLAHIEEFVKSGVNLTKQLLGIAKGGKYEVKPTDINAIIASSAELFGRTRKEISIHQRLQKDLQAVNVDKNQIHQVFLNLFVNAWHAMPDGGELIIESKSVFLDAFYTKSYGLAAGPYVRISVTDTGSGMDEVIRKRVFDPFFTTKEMGRGTGLGLASAYGIISNHSGIINVYSEEGQGSTFNVYLPITDRPVEPHKSYSQKIVSGNETILLVDDEETIVEIGAEILERLGYQVLTALSGQEAINAYRQNRERIDLVLLDMIMPGMNGGETFDQLKKLDAQVEVLLSSGYSLNGQAQTILERGCAGFIQKPFSVASLSEKMREILDRKRRDTE